MYIIARLGIGMGTVLGRGRTDETQFNAYREKESD